MIKHFTIVHSKIVKLDKNELNIIINVFIKYICNTYYI